MTAEDLQRLIDEHTQESLYLEFKRGDALGRQNNQRAELIKDVTGLANAGGGRIIYGIAEGRPAGRRRRCRRSFSAGGRRRPHPGMAQFNDSRSCGPQVS